MLSFFRRLLHSRVGIIVTLVALAIIAVAFAAGDITGLRHSAGPLLGAEIAKVGDATLTEDEVRDRVRLAIDNARQSNPGIDMNQFLAGGGLDDVINQMIDGLALEQFGRKNGMAVSKRAIDGEIASIPAFQGITGSFDQKRFEELLRQRRISERLLRKDIERDLIRQWLVEPTFGANQVPEQLALPYASLVLERRQGEVGLIPIAAIGAGAQPSEKEVADFYKANRQRYVIPERRVIRYALVTADMVKEQAKPSDADVAAAYKAAGNRFAPSEKRTIRQVVLADQAAANALAAKVKAGTPMAKAASDAGLSASLQPGIEKAAYAGQTSAAVADAAFSAAKGAIVGPVRGALGWYVLSPEVIEKVPGKTLEQAKAELATEVAKRKTGELLARLQETLSDGISGNSTFDELVGDNKLQAQKTGTILPSGQDPYGAATVPDPHMLAVVKAGFSAAPDDDPQLVPIGNDGSFALVAVDKVVPSAPQPLAKIHVSVARDFQVDRALKAARQAAIKVIAAVNGGTPLEKALAATGLRLPPPQKVDSSRADLARAGDRIPPPITLMFAMAEKKGKMLEAPNRAGYFIIYLDRIQPGDAKGNTAVITDARAGLGGVVGREYSEQFVDAVHREVGVKRNEAAIQRLRVSLGGQNGASAD